MGGGGWGCVVEVGEEMGERWSRRQTRVYRYREENSSV